MGASKLLVTSICALIFAQTAVLPVTIENFTWTREATPGIELMSCRVTNHFNRPMTMTALTFELYAADGTKVGERLAFMETIPPGQPASYTNTFMPEYEHFAQPVAYIKFGKLDGNVEGRRYTIIAPPGLSEAWSPAIAEARLRAEAVAQRQAAKKAKAEDKKKKKAEKEAQEKAEREARKAKSGGQ